jgi:hypothetical protein
LGGLGERVHRFLGERRAAYMEDVALFFRAAIAAGEVGPAAPGDLALAWQTFLDGLLVNQVFPPAGEEHVQDRLDVLWAFWWRGVGGGGSGSGG